MGKKFELGRKNITPKVHASISAEDIQKAIERHQQGDWGDISENDKAANEEALISPDTLLSSYKSKDDIKFWIITEWNRSVTTVLLPEEY